MPLRFWIKRFLLVYAGAFAVLMAAGLLRARPLAQVVAESALWAGIGAGIFTATRVLRSRRGEACELCGDTPGGQPQEQCERREP